MKTLKNSRIYAYLAGPYSHPELSVRRDRFEWACHVANKLMEAGECIFSPIAHSHSIEVWGSGNIKGGEFWLNQDFAILQHASKMYVMKLTGWETSDGLRREIEFCLEHEIPMEDIWP